MAVATFVESKGNSTLGMALLYGTGASVSAVESWTRVPDVKGMPSLGSEPNLIDTTTLAETLQETGINGLKGSQVLEFTANLTDKLETCWNTGVCGITTTDSNRLFFCIYHPSLAKASAFEGDPAPLDYGDVEVNSVLETSLYVAMSSASTRITTPTTIVEYSA